MTNQPIDVQAADDAFCFYMREQFAVAAKHLDRGDVDGARKAVRKAYSLARQIRAEMLDCAQADPQS